MDTRELLWRMLVRGCGWTTGLGALLGAGYGIVLLATMMLSLGQFATPNNDAFPLILVMIYSGFIAAIFGAVVAGLIGVVAGPLGGILCAGMTRLFFFPLRNPGAYRLVAEVAAFFYGILAIVVAVRLISTSGLAPAIETARQVLMLYFIPGLLGGLAGIYISRQVTDLFVTAPLRAESTPTPVSATKTA